MSTKKQGKEAREEALFTGLVNLYIQTGQPIGSNTLRENGFEDISSATIRNDFQKLEERGLVKQPHLSGGRVPTSQGFKYYAEIHENAQKINEAHLALLDNQLKKEGRIVAGYLQNAAQLLSELSGCAVFLSAPRFDQDMIIDMKLVDIDHRRCLCVVITDFGLVHTEVLYTPQKLSQASLKKFEAYFRYRMTQLDKPDIDPEEEKIAQQLYNEMMLRHIVGYTNFSAEDLYKTGFSCLLEYPEFRDISMLSNGLSLFENPSQMRFLLNECCAEGDLKYWIGDDLGAFNTSSIHCSVVSIPYYVHQKKVGAIALLGPLRMPYPKVFALLRKTSSLISENLTKNLYKFKISYREPHATQLDLQTEHPTYLGKAECLLLEDKT